MKNLKIGLRLGIAFAAMIVLIVVVAMMGVAKMRAQEDQTTHITTNLVPTLAASNELSYHAVDIARIVRNLILLTSEADLASNKAALEKAGAASTARMAEIEALLYSDEDRTAFAAVSTARANFRTFTDQVIAPALANNKAEATRLLYGPGYATQGAYLAALKTLVDVQNRQITIASDASHRDATEGMWVMILAALIAGIAGLTCAWLITRSVTRPLKSAVESADRVASGDLSIPVPTGARDETGQLLNALQRMQDSLLTTVMTVRDNAHSVALASAEISQGNTDLSGRTEEQASALEETAASMEQLGSTVRQNADNAQQANQLALQARTSAMTCGDVVGEVVETMKGINDSSKRIVDIIAVIDSIAFQTNILALNAAVEAARAGEQGRGFAVVASEVRNLAQRSAEAAKEIKGLITTSVTKVELGTAQVDRAGESMGEVVASIRRVADIMGEISAATVEQSQGVAQVGQAVNQMDLTTQQNAALVEESAAAAVGLKEQADALVQAMAVFNVTRRAEHDDHGTAPRALGAPAFA